MLATIAIVGRPNVGKSTLFNRMIGERRAIVHDRPGVTRDRNYGEIELWERRCILVDTGGLEPESGDDLFEAMRGQAQAAMAEADVLIFVLDRKMGITPADEMAAQILRQAERPVFCVVNKIDDPRHEDELGEFWQLGFDELYPVSAEHGRGLYSLEAAIYEALPPADAEASDTSDAVVDEDGQPVDYVMPTETRIAIVGRPNIGKSTLANRMCGQDRHLVHDAPGTTMDAVDSTFESDGRDYRIVDTAGIRRRARISDQVEGFAVSRAIRSIERCHVTLLMIDGTQPITDQDARLARLVIDRGRAVVVLVNRWDLTRDLPERNARKVEEEIERKLPHLSWAPVLYISALTGKGVGRILSEVNAAFAAFNTHIKTGELNRFLEAALERNSPPQVHHRPVRIHYVTQARVRPPTFVFFTNNPEGIKAPYQRYLSNRLREAYGFDGTPLRLQFRMKRKLAPR